MIFNSAMDISMPIIERQADYTQLAISLSALLALLVFLMVKILFKGYYQNLLYFVSKGTTSDRTVVTKNVPFQHADIYLIIASIISISSALSTLVFYSPFFEVSSSINPLYILAASLVFVVVSLSLTKLGHIAISWLYDAKGTMDAYSKRVFEIVKLLGIIIFPFFILLNFTPEDGGTILTISILALLIAAMTAKIFFFFYYLFKIKFFNHYSFLYFCIFEILPILFIVKIINAYIGN